MRSAKKITVEPQATIREAIEAIDRGVMQIALVVDDDHLLGTISDGDIRRAFLKGRNLDDPINDIYNPHPVIGHINQPQEDLVQLALAHGLKQLPMLNENGQLAGIEYIADHLHGPRKTNPVVLMAGGLGTRLRPLTLETPKPMLTVGSKPILETILESFVRYGFQNFYFSVNYKSEKIREYFGNGERFGVSITYLNESEQLGTAGALSMLPEGINQPLLVMNGDLLTNVNFEHLLNYHQLAKSKATMCVREYQLQVPYGVVHTNGATISEIREKPMQKFFVNAGIYVLEPEVLQRIPHQTQFDMPQLYQQLLDDEEKVCSFPIKDYWMDIGQPNDFEQANQEYTDFFNV